MTISKLSKETLELLDGQEIRSLNYEGVVGIEKNKVIRDGKIIDTLNNNRKVNRLWKEYIYQEYGTTNTKEIMRREGF